MKNFYTRKELYSKLESDLNCFLTLIKNADILTSEQIEKKLNSVWKNSKKLTNKIDKIANIQTSLDFIPGVFSLAHHRINKLDKKTNNLSGKIQAYNIALEICKLNNFKDTSSFSEAMLHDGTIDKIIQNRYESEVEYNKEVEKTQNGFKSYIYQHLDDNLSFDYDEDSEKEM